MAKSCVRSDDVKPLPENVIRNASSSTHGKLMVRKSDAAKETDRDKSDDDPKLALSGQKRLA